MNTTNPNIQEWIEGVSEMLPHSQQRLLQMVHYYKRTGMYFIALRKHGNSVFKITQHVSTPALQDAIDWIFDTFDWEQVTEFGITRWRERGTDFRF